MKCRMTHRAIESMPPACSIKGIPGLCYEKLPGKSEYTYNDGWSEGGRPVATRERGRRRVRSNREVVAQRGVQCGLFESSRQGEGVDA